MNQSKMEAWLSQSLDGDLDPEREKQLQKALCESASLRELKSDLEHLKQIGTTQTPECSPFVFTRLNQKVKQQYQRRGFWRFSRRSIPALGMAALLVMILGVSLWFRNGDDPLSSGLQRASMQNQVMHSQAQFHQSINRMETLALLRMTKIAPEWAHLFSKELKLVDHAIRACESVAARNPENPHHHASLSQVYEAKVFLLETILRS